MEVTGDFACFTRPEMKVERVSYPCITPSAARGVFTAIYWHPGMTWHITRIELLKPIRWANIRRNELDKVTACFVEDARVQRGSLILRDVHYRLYGEFDYSVPEYYTADAAEECINTRTELDLFSQPAKDRKKTRRYTAEKHVAIFSRRAEFGRCFNTPYLGCREFSCKSFRLVRDPENEPVQPIAEDLDFDFMLYDIDFSNPSDPRPMFYRPRMRRGVIIVPKADSDEVFK